MNRRFEGIWIPAEIWLAYQVDLKLRILVSEIKSLDSGPAGCVASNEYFAKQLNCDKTTVSKLITKAVKNKWISREMTYKPGSKEVQTRHLRFIEFHGVTQGKTPQELRAQNTGFDWKTPLHLCKTPLASMQDPLALVQGYNTLSIIEVLSIYNKELLNLQEQIEQLEMTTLEQGIRCDVDEENTQVVKLKKVLGQTNEKYLPLVVAVIDFFNEEAKGIQTHGYGTKSIVQDIVHWAKSGITLDQFKVGISFKVQQFISMDSPQYINLGTILRKGKFDATVETAQASKERESASSGKTTGNVDQGKMRSAHKKFNEWVSRNNLLADQTPTLEEFSDVILGNGKWEKYLGGDPKANSQILKDTVEQLANSATIPHSKYTMMEMVFFTVKKS